MKKSLLELIVLSVFLSTMFVGCYSPKNISFEAYETQQIQQIVTIKNDTLKFGQKENKVLKINENMLIYQTNNGESKSITGFDIKELKVNEYSSGKTIGAILGGIAEVGVVVLIVLAVFGITG